jgi:Flp pilus assembly protein TadG
VSRNESSHFVSSLRRVARPAACGIVRDEGGSVAIIFALTVSIVMALVGAAIDFGRVFTTRNQMQAAIDASVLAAARAWQIDNDLTVAEAQGRLYYDKNKSRMATSEVSGFTPDVARNAIVMQARAQVPAPFLSFMRGGEQTISKRLPETAAAAALSA